MDRVQKMGIELRLLNDLPIVAIDVVFEGRKLRLNNVLLDTGSAGTILDADVVADIGVRPEGTDQTAILHGIGGTEIVFTKWFDSVALGSSSVNPCRVQIGAMDHGLDIQGIIGFDFIRAANLIIDTVDMRIYPKVKNLWFTSLSDKRTPNNSKCNFIFRLILMTR